MTKSNKRIRTDSENETNEKEFIDLKSYELYNIIEYKVLDKMSTEEKFAYYRMQLKFLNLQSEELTEMQESFPKNKSEEFREWRKNVFYRTRTSLDININKCKNRMRDLEQESDVEHDIKLSSEE